MIVVPMPMRELTELSLSLLERHEYRRAERPLWQLFELAQKQTDRARAFEAIDHLASCKMALGEYDAAQELLLTTCWFAAYDRSRLVRAQYAAAENTLSVRWAGEIVPLAQQVELQLRMELPWEAEALVMPRLAEVSKAGPATGHKHWYLGYLLFLYAQIKLADGANGKALDDLKQAEAIASGWGHRAHWLLALIDDLRRVKKLSA